MARKRKTTSRTNSQQTATWAELDALDTADGIANLLIDREIVGLPYSKSQGALSNATGWYVDDVRLCRWLHNGADTIPLTEAETNFVRTYYPGLDVSRWSLDSDHSDILAELPNWRGDRA
jgi:hypothetical protein